ncbi:alpha/beta fold hydrolase [Rhodoblastus sp.]|uniref:alpha/beta hydrolase n=1 Tax=Rhodoblastus sp. TaxID=1962975 RepID=UPI0025F79E0A|nr:alpha/beta fold hydrolase [Rhodoblastus sp.]
MTQVMAIISLPVLGVGLGLAVFWLIGSFMVSWRKYPAFSAAVAPASDFMLSTPDGLSVAATFWPGAKLNSPGILLMHGLGDTRQAVAANADWLAKQGFAVMTIDLRGHGQSSRAPHSFGLNESIDAQTAFDWLKRRQQGAPVGVIGISLGGAASLLGTSGPLRADALVLQAVYPDIRRAIRNRIAAYIPRPLSYVLEPLLSYQSPLRFGVWPDRLTPILSLASYEGPVLIAGGERDVYTPPSESREMLAAAAQGRGLLLLQGMNHPEASAAQSDEYREKILAFFSSTLGAP